MRNRALGNKLRPADHQPLFPVIAALFLPFGMHDVDRPMGRGMQGPGMKFSQRASASGSGKIHKPTARTSAEAGALQVAVWPVTIE